MKHKLKAILDSFEMNQNDLAELLGITYQSVSIKMNGHSDFTQTEIFKMIKLFGLKPEEVVDIFFNSKDKYGSDEEE